MIEDFLISELYAARMKLVYSDPLLGETALMLVIEVLDESNWCKTFAVDGRVIYVNRQFAEGLYYDHTHPDTRHNGRRRLVFCLAHEIWHVILGHLLRRGDRDPKIWGWAIDYAVNALLVEENIGLAPEGILYDPRRFNSSMTVETIFNILKRNPPPEGTETLDQHIEPEPSSEPGDQNQKDQSEQEPEEGKDDIRIGDGNEPPKPVSMDKIDAMKDDLEQLMLRAEERDSDNLPASLKRAIARLRAPRLMWHQLISASFKSIDNSHYSFEALSDETWASLLYHRKRWYPGCGYSRTFCAVIPTLVEDEIIKAVIAYDASASVSDDELRKQMSEMKGIMRDFPVFEVLVLTFDTKIYNPMVFTQNNIHKLDEYRRTKVKGRGGTDFNAVYDYCKEAKFEADRIIIHSDGLPNSGWGDPHYGKSLFVIHNQSNQSIRAPFGQTVYLH